MANPNCCFMIIAGTFLLSSQSPRGIVSYRHSSYNAVLLYRGILSNMVFSKPKTALKFYLTRFFHKKEQKLKKNLWICKTKSLRNHLWPIIRLYFHCIILITRGNAFFFFWLENYLIGWIYHFLYRAFCSNPGLWK